MKTHSSYLCFDLSSVHAACKEMSDRRAILCFRLQFPLSGEKPRESFKSKGLGAVSQAEECKTLKEHTREPFSTHQ